MCAAVLACSRSGRLSVSLMSFGRRHSRHSHPRVSRHERAPRPLLPRHTSLQSPSVVWRSSGRFGQRDLTPSTLQLGGQPPRLPPPDLLTVVTGFLLPVSPHGQSLLPVALAMSCPLWLSCIRGVLRCFVCCWSSCDEVSPSCVRFVAAAVASAARSRPRPFSLEEAAIQSCQMATAANWPLTRCTMIAVPGGAQHGCRDRYRFTMQSFVLSWFDAEVVLPANLETLRILFYFQARANPALCGIGQLAMLSGWKLAESFAALAHCGALQDLELGAKHFAA